MGASGFVATTSNKAEPPVPATRLHSSNPSAERVEQGNHENPNSIDSRQSDAIARWKVTSSGHHLVRFKALHHAENNAQQVDQVEVRKIERERDTAEHDERLVLGRQLETFRRFAPR